MLYKAETAGGGDPARCYERTQDTPLVTATVTTILLRAHSGSESLRRKAHSVWKPRRPVGESCVG